jgi:superfamily II DNA or RNA helicase
MILARPTKSLTRFIQMVGRVLRPFEGKTKALMLDHSGSTERLGYPTDDLPLELDDGRPKAAGTKRTKERLPSACTSCSYMRPPGVHVCPVCGFAPERQSNVETREGELVKVARQRKADKFEKQSAYSQLIHIADERGYSDGWVSHKYRALFGVWPRGLDSRPIEPTPEMRSWVKSQAIRFAKRKEAGHASIGA